MARSSSTGGLGFRVQVEGLAKTDAEFKQVRKELNSRVKAGLQKAGEDIALPAIRGLAPVKSGRLKGSLVAKATSRRAYITTSLRGKKGRYVGLLEYGGTITTPIEPKGAKALAINGDARASVTSPRTYKGKAFMRQGVNSRKSQIRDAIRENVLEAFVGDFEVE